MHHHTGDKIPEGESFLCAKRNMNERSSQIYHEKRGQYIVVFAFILETQVTSRTGRMYDIWGLSVVLT